MLRLKPRDNGTASPRVGAADATAAVDKRAHESGLQRAGNTMNVSKTGALVPLPTDVCCWAASLAMVVSSRDGVSTLANEVATRTGMNTTDSYGGSSTKAVISTWGLRETAPVSAMPDYWAGLLNSQGPLWIVEVGAQYYAVPAPGRVPQQLGTIDD